MQCKDCKYKWNIGNTDETGYAICSYPDMHMPVNVNDPCHFILTQRSLKCGDCENLYEDTACMGCQPEDSAYHNGKLCKDYRDKKEAELSEILSFWKSRNYYDRNRIERLIDEFERSYNDLTEQQNHIYEDNPSDDSADERINNAINAHKKTK